MSTDAAYNFKEQICPRRNHNKEKSLKIGEMKP